jgi:hypothetical protein
VRIVQRMYCHVSVTFGQHNAAVGQQPLSFK